MGHSIRPRTYSPDLRRSPVSRRKKQHALLQVRCQDFDVEPNSLAGCLRSGVLSTTTPEITSTAEQMLTAVSSVQFSFHLDPFTLQPCQPCRMKHIMLSPQPSPEFPVFALTSAQVLLVHGLCAGLPQNTRLLILYLPESCVAVMISYTVLLFKTVFLHER